MKLLNYTSRYFALLLLILISIWAVALYYAMLDEIYDSLDDGLENQKLLILSHSTQEDLANPQSNFEEGNYTISKISRENYSDFEETYRDTLMYMHNEDDFEPVRIYTSTFKNEDDYYRIKVITSMVEEDDLIEDLVQYLIGLYVLLIVSLLILNNFLLKRAWQPFYNIVSALRTFKIEQDAPIVGTPTVIEEFNILNESVERLTRKSKESYVAQKQFIENASHELQTPLAVCINKLELFLEHNNPGGKQLEDLAIILDNLNRLTRLNKSLLLLSKIENRQFTAEEPLDLNELTKTILRDFEDFATHKNIALNLEEGSLKWMMNKDLALILITNLLKNAIVHGNSNSEINIEISANTLCIKNHGIDKPLPLETLFSRFKSVAHSKKSTGLGMAIAKAITEKYNLKLEYNYEKMHVFTVKFPV